MVLNVCCISRQATPWTRSLFHETLCVNENENANWANKKSCTSASPSTGMEVKSRYVWLSWNTWECVAARWCARTCKRDLPRSKVILGSPDLLSLGFANAVRVQRCAETGGSSTNIPSAVFTTHANSARFRWAPSPTACWRQRLLRPALKSPAQKSPEIPGPNQSWNLRGWGVQGPSCVRRAATIRRQDTVVTYLHMCGTAADPDGRFGRRQLHVSIGAWTYGIATLSNVQFGHWWGRGVNKIESSLARCYTSIEWTYDIDYSKKKNSYRCEQFQVPRCNLQCIKNKFNDSFESWILHNFLTSLDK